MVSVTSLLDTAFLLVDPCSCQVLLDPSNLVHRLKPPLMDPDDAYTSLAVVDVVAVLLEGICRVSQCAPSTLVAQFSDALLTPVPLLVSALHAICHPPSRLPLRFHSALILETCAHSTSFFSFWLLSALPCVKRACSLALGPTGGRAALSLLVHALAECVTVQLAPRFFNTQSREL